MDADIRARLKRFDRGEQFACVLCDAPAVTMLGSADPEHGTAFCKAHFLAKLDERRAVVA